MFFNQVSKQIDIAERYSCLSIAVKILGGEFCLRCLFLDKSAGVGDLRRSSKEMTVEEPDCSDSEVD